MTIPVVIIGAGPAGTAAAIQLRRSGISFLLFEKERIGGLLNEANRVENFPGVPGGVPGRVLAARLRRQLDAAGIAVKKGEALQLARRNGLFTIRTKEGMLTAGTVILASGTQPLPLPPPLDQVFLRSRIVDSVLPLLKAKGKTIAVIGGGDAAFDYALSLAGKNRVHILVRSNRPRALPLLVDRCRLQPGITIHENCRLTDAAPRPGGAEIVLRTECAPGGSRKEIACDRILAAIGREPALQFLDPTLQASLPDLIQENKIHLTGDAGNGRFRQAAIAAADGLRAAMAIQAGGNACA